MNKFGNLIWIDLEMTGLNPLDHVIIEIATVVTDSALNVVAEGPNLAIFQDEEELGKMDRWNVHCHTKTGLIDRVKESNTSAAEAEAQTLDFLKCYVEPGVSPMCGNTICQDRRFLVRYMPDLERFFHYRHIDVSTLKELVTRWDNNKRVFNKKPLHISLSDVYDSIEELKYYRSHLLNF